jgi:hypothetical protein
MPVRLPKEAHYRRCERAAQTNVNRATIRMKKRVIPAWIAGIQLPRMASQDP